MRKIFLVSLLVGLMVFGAVAESNFGIKGGLTLGRISNSDLGSGVTEKFKMGFAGGGMMIMPLNEQMHIQAEAMYVMKGEKWDFDGYEVTLNVNVIEVPVMLRFMASKYMAVYGGPSFNYIMTAEADTPGGTIDLKDEGNITDMAFGLSLGAQYMMDKIVFDARYDLGLTSIIEDDTGAPIEEDEGRLSTIYVTVGYLF